MATVLPSLGVLALAAASPLSLHPVKKSGQAEMVVPSEQSPPASWEAVAVPQAEPASPVHPWLGKEVMLKSAAVVPHNFAGRVEPNRRYRVQGIDGDMLWIYAGGTGDWIRADDVILATDADRYFTEQLRLQEQEQKEKEQAKHAAEPPKSIELEPEPAQVPPKPAETPRPQDEAAKAAEAKAESIRTYNRRAMARYNQGDYVGAIADYTEAIRLDPTRASLFNNRAAAWLDQGDDEKAIADYTEAIRLDPNVASAYHGRALAHMGKREYDKAIADDDAAIRLRPGLVGAYVNRGHAWFDKNAYDKALADFNEAIRLDPDSPSSFNSRGNVREAQKDQDAAIADYAEAIRLDPKYARARTNRGRLLEAKGDYVGALADYDEAVRLEPDNPAGHRGRAWIWATCPDARLRDAKTAVSSATRACELAQWKDPACLETLAAAEAEAGRFPEAVKRQTEALGLVPENSPDRPSLQARLALYQAGKPYRQTRPGDGR